MQSYLIIIICVISVPLKCNRTQKMLSKQMNTDKLRGIKITDKRQKRRKEKIFMNGLEGKKKRLYFARF